MAPVDLGTKLQAVIPMQTIGDPCVKIHYISESNNSTVFGIVTTHSGHGHQPFPAPPHICDTIWNYSRTEAVSAIPESGV